MAAVGPYRESTRMVDAEQYGTFAAIALEFESLRTRDSPPGVALGIPRITPDELMLGSSL